MRVTDNDSDPSVWLFLISILTHIQTHPSRDAQTSSSSSGVDTEVFPSQPRDTTPACPGSPPSYTCPQHLTYEASRRHLNLMPLLDPFNMITIHGPNPFMHIHIGTSFLQITAYCLTFRLQSMHQEQLRVQFLAQGYFATYTRATKELAHQSCD